MLGLGKLAAAIARLAGSLDAISDTADSFNCSVRQRLLLDGPVIVPELPAPEIEANGKGKGKVRA